MTVKDDASNKNNVPVQPEQAQERPKERPQYQNRGQNQSGQSEQSQERPPHQNRSQNPRYNQNGQNNQGNNQYQNRNHDQSTKGQNERPDGGRPKEGGQNRGYYRERDNQPRQHQQSSAPKYNNTTRNRAEETIDDIKEDIVRIEKEIELEIKEIKSLKL